MNDTGTDAVLCSCSRWVGSVWGLALKIYTVLYNSALSLCSGTVRAYLYKYRCSAIVQPEE